MEQLIIERSEEVRNYAEAIVETVHKPLVVLDKDLRVKVANRAFYLTFQVTREETENAVLFGLGNGQWDIPALRTLPEGVLPRDSQFQDFEVSHEFPGIGRRVMLLNARACPFTSRGRDGSAIQIPITVSLGVASLPDDALSAAALIAAADRGLYAAKHGGRNRAVRFCDVI